MLSTGLSLLTSVLGAYLQELEPLPVALKLQCLVLLEAVGPAGKSQRSGLLGANQEPRSSYCLLKSTWMEWSMTRSAGHTGLIFSGSPPSCFTASRIAAKSTTAGTPLEREEGTGRIRAGPDSSSRSCP